MSVLLFFFKQKTAYEMRISDWSSDVCSSDLPEESVEVGFEAGVFQGDDQRGEDVGEGAGDMVAFRKRSGIGFIREGTIAVELEFTEEMVGGGRGVVRFVVVVLAHGMLRRFDRDPRGLHGDESRRAARPCTRSKA